MAEENGVFTKRQRKKLDHRLRVVEKRDRMLKKDRSSDSAVMEEVFDRLTLMTIYNIMNKGVIRQLHGVVKEGKEARVYWGTDSDGGEFAVKIYLTTTSNFKRMLTYIEGDPRFKNIRKNTRSVIYLWARKEFKNLQTALRAGVRVPRPVIVKNNVLVMEFIGEGGVPAPRLKDQPPEDPESMYLELLEQTERLYSKARLVHGDLSEYNIMNHEERPVLFDLSQAVSVEHPMATELLRRDLNRLNWFFDRLGVEVWSMDRLEEWLSQDE